MPRFLSTPGRRAAAAAAIVSGFQPRAAAQDGKSGSPPQERIRLEYHAPPECFDADTFKALVGGRVPEGWEASPEELARRIDVVVTGEPGHYVGTIELVDETGERVARAVRGRLCSDVVDGIALVTALAIQSRVEEALDHSEPAGAPVPEEPVNVPAQAATGRADTAPEPPRSQGTLTANGPSRAGATTFDESPNTALRVSARAALTTGIGPSVAPGAALGIVFERRSARLGVVLQGFWSGRFEARGVPVRFELLAARVEGCPLVVAIADFASLEPCPFAELGTLTGEAFEDPPAVVRGFPGSAVWLSVGAAGRVVGQFGALTVELEALLAAPVRRERFLVEGGEVLHRVPAWYGGAAAGLGVRF